MLRCETQQFGLAAHAVCVNQASVIYAAFGMTGVMCAARALIKTQE